MIKKELSLKTNFEFNIPRKYGEYHAGNFFHMYILKPTNYDGISKVGIVTSTKFDKNATVRNRTKRIFKDAFKQFLEENSKKSLWIVVHPKVNSKNKKYEEISADVNNVLQKISIS